MALSGGFRWAQGLIDVHGDSHLSEHAIHRGRPGCLPFGIDHRHLVGNAVRIDVEACHHAPAFGPVRRTDIDEPALGVEGDRSDHSLTRMAESLSTDVLRARLFQLERTVACALAHPQRAVRAERQATGECQLARALSRTAEAEQEATLGIEHAYLVRLHVGHDQPTACVLGDRLYSREEVRVVAVDLTELEVDCALEGRLRARWVRVPEVDMDQRWLTIRSHVPVHSDGTTPFVSRLNFSELGYIGITAGVLFRP